MTIKAAIKWLDSTDDYAWPVVKEEIESRLPTIIKCVSGYISDFETPKNKCIMEKELLTFLKSLAEDLGVKVDE